MVGSGRLRHCALLALAACWISGTPGLAAPAHDFTTYKPTFEATRIDDGSAPVMDGDISDAVWAKSKVVDKFYQVEPKGGEPATERTEVRMLYTSDALYFAFYCHDSDPTNIPLGAKARDTNVVNGDFVRVYLDPGMTGRNGYAFEVNVLAGREDGLLVNNGPPIYEWNTIWGAKTKRVADGWTVEIEIPIRSISFNADRKDWGFDLYRRMYRISERVRWTSADPSIQTFDLSHEGILSGIEGMSQGIGLDIQTYAALRYKHEWNPLFREDDEKLALSGNVFYKITPDLTGTLTVNPDFSNTPLDQRRINTNRFALFYPETRDFFLQDAGAFEFGGRPHLVDPNGAAFFSRNIGLVFGEPVPIKVGGKLSGTLFDWNIGAFSALAGGLNGDSDQVLSVVRAAHPVLSESKVGFIFTNGDPAGLSDNTVMGADFQYHDSHMMGDKQFEVDTAFLRSDSSVFGTDDEYTLSINYPNEPWGWNIDLRQIGENFAPALGFVNRTGIRDGLVGVQYLERVDHPFVQWWAVGTQHRMTTDLDNHMQSFQGGIYASVQDNAGDQFNLNVFHNIEDVPAPFGLGGNAVVTAGTHRWTSVDFNVNTSLKRSWTINADVVCCDFFNGKAVQAFLGFGWRPDETWEFIPAMSTAFIDLPTGSISIYVPNLKVNVNFTPDMTIQSELQFDNLSHNFSGSVRYRWEYDPGSELFIALGDSASITERLFKPHYSSDTTQATIRIGHTFRY